MYMNLFGKDNFWKNMIVVITKIIYDSDYEDTAEWIEEMEHYK